MPEHRCSCHHPGTCHGTDVSSGVTRRRFLGLSATAAGAALLAAHTRDAYAAGTLSDRSLVPADKGLSADWVASLYQRGDPTSYTSGQLDHIGMPVGGGCCGQVYLGGDGQLWYWDVDNGPPPAGVDFGGATYASPLTPFSPFGNGFVLRTTADGTTSTRGVDGDGFAHVTFTGQYPLGTVDYRSADCPLGVRLEAFSPFVPTAPEDSTLPAIVLAYTLTNTSSHDVTGTLTGWAENPVCLRSRTAQPIDLTSGSVDAAGFTGVWFGAANARTPPPRQDVVFEDWERASYGDWAVEGEAFGSGPVLASSVPAYMLRFGNLNVQGQRFVTSHNFIAADGDATKADSYTGKLTSTEFTVSRRYVRVLLGGGNQPGTACLNVVVDGAVVASATGDDTEPLTPHSMDLSRYQGKTAHIEIVDAATGGWGHVNVDTITFTDVPASDTPVDELPDGGTMAIAALEPDAVPRPSIADWSSPTAIATSGEGPTSVDGALGTIAGAVTVPVHLAPGQRRTIRFVLAWYFPVPDRVSLSFLTDIASLRRHYANQFGSATDVASHVVENLPRLEGATRAWVDTWYNDSTLPHWFLERTLATASTFATSTCLRFTNGRFYAWEGVDCCAGTCEHVWNYAQSIARLFPALERDTRQRVDLGLGFHADTGEIGNRAEADMGWATDGQCGTILRVYREHLMSADTSFVTQNWPRIRLALEWVMSQDTRHDGTLEGPQPNTLDATWYGEVAWMTGMYDAALLAGASMAEVCGDTEFAARCRDLAAAGATSLATDLWTGEYFIQLVDPNHPEAVNSNIGCHVDQLFGQSLAMQLGLPRVFPADRSTTALRNIYRYNFVPDPAAYRAANTAIPGGRWFAMAGEPAVIMTTFPHGGAAQANGDPAGSTAAYFNETWTGQEYQLAAHMLYEGLTDEGLTITRAVHDRYAATKRNPYDEIECSEHYARAMAGYGVFLAACGFSCDGPSGRLGFAPRLTPDHFAAAFTAAEGWGLYSQVRDGRQQVSALEVRYGSVRVASLVLELPVDASGNVEVGLRLDGHDVPVSTSISGTTLETTLTSPLVVGAGHRLEVAIRLP